jgi:hypothetical protein
MQLRLAAAASMLALVIACVDSPKWTPPEGEERTLGAELFVVLCDRVAASEMPSDVHGKRSNDICHHSGSAVADTPPRLRALVDNRARLISALDAALTAGKLNDQLGTFLTELLPFYEPPRELLPQVTRAFADVTERMAKDPAALAAFQHLSARRGYRPLEHAIGVLQAVLKYPRLHQFLVAFMDATGPDGKAHEAFRTLTSALALELATYEAKPADVKESTLEVTHDLFFQGITNEVPDSERWLAKRDARGLVLPAKLCTDASCMFVDMDGDGKADMDPNLGGFRAAAAIPTPFRVFGLMPDKTLRDDHGRALDSTTQALVYEYVDVSKTFAGGLGKELLPLFASDSKGRSIVLDLVDAFDVLLGPREMADAPYGHVALRHNSRDTTKGIGLDLVRAMSILGRSPDIEPFLDVSNQLVRNHETELAALVKTLLDAKALANASTAQFAAKNEFWDDVTQWITLMSRTSRLPGQETMLEGLMRAIADERARHFGDITATMLRYSDKLSLDPNDKNNLPRGQFITPVDRSRIDDANNRSIMERSLHLVSEINGQRGICNKTAFLVVQPCSVMDFDDLGRVFGGSMSEAWQLKLGLGLNTLIDFLSPGGSKGSTLGAIMGIDGLDDYPGPEPLMRMLFTDNSIVDLMLDPLLVRNAPDSSEQYWLKKVYANTIEAWEVPLDFTDGTRASFWNSFRPLAEAFNRHDYDPLDAEHVNDEHSFYIYMELASTLGRYYGNPQAGYATSPSEPFFNVSADAHAFEGLVADMVAGPTLVPTPCDAAAQAANRCWVTQQTIDQHQTNLGLFERLHDILAALDNITLPDGRDGIDVMSGMVELLLNPHKSCDPAGTGLVRPDGTGACDDANAPYPPFTIRRSAGEEFAATNLGTRYDGSVQARSATWVNLIQETSGRPIVEGGSFDVHRNLAKTDASGNKVPYKPKRYVSVMQHLLGTFNDVDAAYAPNAIESADVRLARWRGARSGIVDQFFATDGKSFDNRTARMLLLTGLDFAKTRIASHRKDGDLDAWLSGLEGRAEKFARTPLVTGSLDLLNASQKDSKLQSELSALLAYLFDAQSKQESFDTTLYAMLDLVQVLRDDENMVPVLNAVSRMIAPNTPESVQNGSALGMDDGSLDRTTSLLRDILRVDEYASLSSLLENLVSASSKHLNGGETPLETLIDVTAEVNRTRPELDQGKQMRAEDFKATFQQINDFLTDERRGLERLYDIVQHRQSP